MDLAICITNSRQELDPLLLVGQVAGAIKKHLRGDAPWSVMRPRIEKALNDLISTMVTLAASNTSLEFQELFDRAIEANISKVEARLRLNTIRGDGARETSEQMANK